MAEDDRALMERLAALEAEVKADADAQRARKDAAIAKVREQRAAQQAERDQLRARQAAIVTKKAVAAPVEDDDDSPRPRRSRTDDLGDALALARKASAVKNELTRAPGKGEKSWMISGVASLALGPIGWLYAGSFRESIPAAAAWTALALVASKILPMLLLMPVLFVALPLSGITGVVYAYRYNRTGRRQRLFTDKPAGKSRPPAKQLRG